MNKKFLTVIVHIAAWACFLLLPLIFFQRPRDPQYQVSEVMKWMFITLDLYLVGFYYLNSLVMVPRLLAKKKWLWYFLAIAVCLFIFIQIPLLFENALREEFPERAKRFRSHRRNPYNPFTGGTALFFLVFTVSTCIKVIQQWLASEQQQKLIEHEKINTELSFLKSQINPHFLFNTLNNIYTLAVVKSDATAGAVMKLSSIMRYVISDTKQHMVPLEKEIKFIQDFIDLQKVRLTDKVKIEFTVLGEIHDRQIAPLLFIPFVENAFKYGISAKEDSTINIKIEVKNGDIEFFCDNKIVAQQTDSENNNGIGLKNTRRRLEILYKDKHELIIQNDNNFFQVHLIISQ